MPTRAPIRSAGVVATACAIEADAIAPVIGAITGAATGASFSATGSDGRSLACGWAADTEPALDDPGAPSAVWAGMASAASLFSAERVSVADAVKFASVVAGVAPVRSDGAPVSLPFAVAPPRALRSIAFATSLNEGAPPAGSAAFPAPTSAPGMACWAVSPPSAAACKASASVVAPDAFAKAAGWLKLATKASMSASGAAAAAAASSLAASAPSLSALVDLLSAGAASAGFAWAGAASAGLACTGTCARGAAALCCLAGAG